MTIPTVKLSCSSSQRRAFFLLIASVGLVLAGCGSSSHPASTSKASTSGTSSSTTSKTRHIAAPSNGVLTLADPSEADSLDPAYGAGGQDYSYLYPLYDTLVEQNPSTLAPEPGLATSWQFTRATTFVMQLRHNVTFQDGTPFNAAAVVYNIKRFIALGQHNDLSDVSNVTANGNYTVTLTLTDPDYALPEILSDRGGMMVSPTAVQKYPSKAVTSATTEFGLHPVGAGPYEFVQWIPGDEIVYKPYPGYWGTKNTSVKELVFKIITNPSTITDGLISGSLSTGIGLTASDVTALKKAGVVVSVAPTNAFLMVYFNLSQSPLNNKDVRLAFNYALNRQQLLEGGQEGYGQVEWFPTPSSDPLYSTADAPSFPYDPAKAKQLLADAGYPHGVTITANTYGAEGATLVALVESQLSAVGINFKVTTLSVSPMITTYFVQHNYNTELSGWSGRPSQNQTYDTLFGDPSFQNPGNVPIPGFSAALTALNAASTPAAQKQAMSALDKLVDSFAPYAPLYFEVNVTAYQPYVHGYFPDTLGKDLAIKDLTLGA